MRLEGIKRTVLVRLGRVGTVVALWVGVASLGMAQTTVGTVEEAPGAGEVRRIKVEVGVPVIFDLQTDAERLLKVEADKAALCAMIQQRHRGAACEGLAK